MPDARRTTCCTIGARHRGLGEDAGQLAPTPPPVLCVAARVDHEVVGPLDVRANTRD